MDLYERSRHHLHQRLQEALGPEAAGILMAHLPPGGHTEFATRSDLRQLEERLVLKMDALRHELRGETKEVRVEVQRLGRTLMLSFVTVMAVLNGILFAALQIAG